MWHTLSLVCSHNRCKKCERNFLWKKYSLHTTTSKQHDSWVWTMCQNIQKNQVLNVFEQLRCWMVFFWRKVSCYFFLFYVVQSSWFVKCVVELLKIPVLLSVFFCVCRLLISETYDKQGMRWNGRQHETCIFQKHRPPLALSIVRSLHRDTWQVGVRSLCLLAPSTT